MLSWVATLSHVSIYFPLTVRLRVLEYIVYPVVALGPILKVLLCNLNPFRCVHFILLFLSDFLTQGCLRSFSCVFLFESFNVCCESWLDSIEVYFNSQQFPVSLVFVHTYLAVNGSTNLWNSVRCSSLSNPAKVCLRARNFLSFDCLLKLFRTILSWLLLVSSHIVIINLLTFVCWEALLKVYFCFTTGVNCEHCICELWCAKSHLGTYYL